MKTVLPAKIATIEEAKKFLTDLHNNGEIFHPEDSAHEIIWNIPAKQVPTFAECELLDSLMIDIYNLPGNDGKHDNSIMFDPCAWILNLVKKFF